MEQNNVQYFIINSTAQCRNLMGTKLHGPIPANWCSTLVPPQSCYLPDSFCLPKECASTSLWCGVGLRCNADGEPIVNYCHNIVCGGNSVCSSGDKDFVCTCAPGWIGGGAGALCSGYQLRLNAFVLYPPQIFILVHLVISVVLLVCFRNTHRVHGCYLAVNHCEGIDCGGLSKCKNGATGYTCQCAKGWTAVGSQHCKGKQHVCSKPAFTIYQDIPTLSYLFSHACCSDCETNSTTAENSLEKRPKWRRIFLGDRSSEHHKSGFALLFSNT